jgi:hypothetical protein
MKYIISYLLLILFVLPLFSQTKGNISGCITDSTNKALQDANVLFTKADSLVAVISTGQKGCFSLSLDTGNYVIHITHLGHGEYVGEVNITSSGLSLPVIILKNATIELDAVTVQGKDVYESVLNKNIYNVPANIRKTSADVYDILQHIPSLMVNTIERSMKLAGAENFIVMVNNIRRDNFYISLLKPEEIDRIEIIRNPGMRYRDIDAIINIVTKVVYAAGQQFFVEGRLSPISMDNTYLHSAYRHITKNLALSFFATTESFNEKKNEYSLVRDVENEGTIVHTEKYSDRGKALYDKNNSNLSAIIDYTVSPKTFTTLNMFCNYLKNDVSTSYTGNVSFGNEARHDFKSSDDSRKRGNDYGIIAYWQTDFNKYRSVNVEASYKSGKENTDALYRELHNSDLISENRQLRDEHQQSADFQVNFMQQLQKVKLEEGYRGRWSENNTGITTNKTFDNGTKYNDFKHYFYINALGGIGKHFVYQAGIGFDMMKINLNNQDVEAVNVFTPDVMLRYNISNRQNVIFRYNVYRQNPSSQALNPTPVYNSDDSTQVFVGNPELKPFYMNSLSLSYEFFIPDKFSTYLSLYHNLSNNGLRQKKYLENGINYTTYVNTAGYSFYSAFGNFSFNIWQWWQLSLGGSINYNSYKSDDRQLNTNYTSYSVMLQNSIRLNRWSVYASYFPSLKNSTLTGYFKRAEYSNISVSYRRNSWMFAVMTYCLFSQPIETTETYTDGFSEIYTKNNKNQRLRITLRLQYTFQKGTQQADKQKKSKSYNNDEVRISTK